MQKTLEKSVTCKGVGLHSGSKITMDLCPAEPGTGIAFVRTDVTDRDNIIPVIYDNVVDTRLCTVIANDDGVSVGTIEHVMSALRAMNIDNVIIKIDGAEVPIMDGSALPFVDMINEGGIRLQDAPKVSIKVLREVRYEEDGKWVSLKPSDVASFEGVIDFEQPVIGQQKYTISLLNGNFLHDIAGARTFCFEQEVEMMRAAGLARGGSLDNAIVLTDTSVINEDGLRYDDEFIRHKLLDAIGDIYLAGAPVIGAYESYKAGHYMNNKLLHALFADTDNYEIVRADGSDASALSHAGEVIQSASL
ncbi:MAG: UDP-3-O-[3-hydroxymyristoyl] N-acetylglucosamine deacetylase [Micavibrio sp.]|nr:UDP-3-O-[3-hydroxymyristoyl] N-acetylglucosamine deacetylase [Micavibrio sp.]|tara:strand:+ start:586 stop:1500 length:915 start_codon:yes stop_codon:yes gene_type:complete